METRLAILLVLSVAIATLASEGRPAVAAAIGLMAALGEQRELAVQAFGELQSKLLVRRA